MAGTALSNCARRAPPAARITRKDEAFAWLGLIPDDLYVLRRIVAARALIHSLSGRHLYPWRRLGAALDADRKAGQRLHGEAVGLLVAGLVKNSGGVLSQMREICQKLINLSAF